jgi:trigger factor
MGLFSALDRSDKPKFKQLKEDGCLVTFSVEIPAAQAQDETHTFLLRIQQKAKLSGFRPGKAPLDLVKNQFSGHARKEVLNELIRKFLPEALRELNIKPVAAPTILGLSFEEGKPVCFQVQVEVAPQFIPKDYVKICVKRPSYPVTEEALQKRLEELREANARLERGEDEIVDKTHYVVIDYTGSQDGKPLAKLKGEAELVDMSSDQTLEGLSAGLLGMKRGETKDISVKLSSKDSVLTVTLKEIKKKILPALDSELAKDLGFAAFEEFKSKLCEAMEHEGKEKSEREVTRQIEEALLKSNRIPLPPTLVEAQLEHRIEELGHQLLGGSGHWSDNQLADLKAKLRPKAEEELRISYFLSAIAAREKIVALKEDLQAELDKSLSSANNEHKQAEVRRMFEERRESIAALICDRKTMAFLKAKAIYKDQ